MAFYLRCAALFSSTDDLLISDYHLHSEVICEICILLMLALQLICCFHLERTSLLLSISFCLSLLMNCFEFKFIILTIIEKMHFLIFYVFKICMKFIFFINGEKIFIFDFLLALLVFLIYLLLVNLFEKMILLWVEAFYDYDP